MHIIQVITNMIRCLEDPALNGSDPETILDRLEDVISITLRLEESSNAPSRGAIHLLQSARQLLQGVIGESELSQISNLTANHAIGRPSYDIPMSQLQYLVETGFTVPDISAIFHVSVRTIRRRLQAYNLSVKHQYSTMSDICLDDVVKRILGDFPNCGFRRMDGFLRSRGYRIQQKRIRESVRRVDPDGVLLRSLEIHVIRRRAYNVVRPLALWHIDGYHKLIRFANLNYFIQFDSKRLFCTKCHVQGLCTSTR